MAKAEIIRVTDSIWCVRRCSYFTCSYIVASKSGTVLIDAGMDSRGEDMMQGLSAAGLPIESVKAILLTHWHNDHSAGAKAIQDKSGAAIYCHKNEVPYLTRQTRRKDWRGELSNYLPEMGMLVLLKGLLGKAIPVAVEVNEVIHEGQLLFDEFEVIETQGHTEGHICYYYHPDKVLFAGDALAVVNDRVRFMARSVTPDLSSARKSMQKCLDFEINILCPGHRSPLIKDVRGRCLEMQNYLATNNRWPLLG